MILLFALILLIACAGGAILFLSEKAIKTYLSSYPFLKEHSNTVIKLKNMLGFELNVLAGPKNGNWTNLTSMSFALQTPIVNIDLEKLRNERTPSEQKSEISENNKLEKEPSTLPTRMPTLLAPSGLIKNETAKKGAPAKNLIANSKNKKSEEKTQESSNGAAQNKTTAKKETSAEKPGNKNSAKKDQKIDVEEPSNNKELQLATNVGSPPPIPKTKDGKKEHKLGLTYYNGDGIKKDLKLAQKWFSEAAKFGHASAQYNLGIMSYLGQGIKKDYVSAANWFRLAADQGHALAQYNLGFLYFEGKGTKKDNLQAYMWIDRAANQGDEKAKKALATLEKILPKEIFDKKK